MFLTAFAQVIGTVALAKYKYERVFVCNVTVL